MKILFKYSLLCCMLLSMIIFSGCSDNDDLEAPAGYGYLQLHLYKNDATRAVAQGGSLDYLKDAKKIVLTLVHNNQTITQSLELSSVSVDAAEFGIKSDKLQLGVGDYLITGYKILGGDVEDDRAQILQVGYPDDEQKFTIEQNHISRVDMGLDVCLRGNLYFNLQKDFSNFPTTRSEVQEDELFYYDDIAYVKVFYTKDAGAYPDSYMFKTKYLKNSSVLSTDTLSLPAGKYNISQYQLFSADKNTMIMAADVDMDIEVKDVNKELVKSQDLAVVYPKNTLYIKDYINLYNLWKAMDGENWYYQGTAEEIGSNWIFDNRPIDQWGKQPGITLDGAGRVKVLNLGNFNPKGIVPDVIGEFTELDQLYLGTHYDEGTFEFDNATGSELIDPTLLAKRGVDINKNMLSIAKERMAILHPGNHSKMIQGYINKKHKVERKYSIKVYNQNIGQVTNRITGISPAIGKLKKLSTLFIANGLIEKLPQEIANLTSLEQLEIYNTKIKEVPSFIKNLPLASLNFSRNAEISASAMNQGLEDMMNGKIVNHIQLLYINHTALTQLPNNFSNFKKIGLLDLSNNKISGHLNKWGDNIAPVQVYLDYNNIETIADDLCNFDDMETFSATFNKITTFPKMSSSESIYNMTSIDFSDNKISKFSDNFAGVRVETLTLASNSFGTVDKPVVFPFAFSKTKSEIYNLEIQNNNIKEIHKKSIENMKYLQALDMEGNCLDSITYCMNVEYLPYLSGVNFNFNSFKTFPAYVLYIQALNQLYLSYQFDHKTGVKTMKNWPSNIEKHTTLRVLDVSDNDIRIVGKFPSLLNYLNIEGNPNIDITVSDDVCSRISAGTFVFYYDSNQYIKGCPVLDLD